MPHSIFRPIDVSLAAIDGLFTRRGGAQREGLLAILLLAPAATVLIAFSFFPMLFSIFLSLFDSRLGVGPFVGTGNYFRAAADPAFRQSLQVTTWFVLLSVAPGLIISFFIASALFRVGRGRSWFRTLFFLPYITSVVASATVWRLALHRQVGLVNSVLGWLGIPPEYWPDWLLEPRGALNLITGGAISPDFGPSLALCCVIAFEIWHASGFMIVVFLAGLSAIPREYEESARLDGASWFQMTRYVTAPLLSPTLFFLAFVEVVRSFQAFNSFYALTGNGRGPLDTTQTLTVYVFTNFYEYGREGYGAAMATLLAVVIGLVTLLQWRVGARRVHYES